MRIGSRWTRSTASLAVMSAMLGLTVLLPAIERMESGPGRVLESEHSPTSCPPGHDHTICTQIDGSAPLATVRAGRSLPRTEAFARRGLPAGDVLPTSDHRPPSSRGPPAG